MAIEWKKVAFADDAIAKTVLDATGDLLYASDVATPAGLTVVADGHVLAVSAGGVPEWIDKPASTVHAASHKSGGVTDVLALSDLVAGAAVAFDGNQAKDLVVMNATVPPTEVLGKWYFDTTGGDLSLYLCTSIA
jgi:hypothetical protein